MRATAQHLKISCCFKARIFIKKKKTTYRTIPMASDQFTLTLGYICFVYFFLQSFHEYIWNVSYFSWPQSPCWGSWFGLFSFLFYFSSSSFFLTHVFPCVCMFTHMWVACECLWRLEGDTKCLPQQLFTFLIDAVSLAEPKTHSWLT